MEPARTEKGKNPDAGKVRANKIVRCANKEKDAVDVARVRGAVGGVAEAKDRAAVAPVVAGGIVDASWTGLLLAPQLKAGYMATCAMTQPSNKEVTSCQDLTELDPWEPAL
jgi:hypothetical protein